MALAAVGVWASSRVEAQTGEIGLKLTGGYDISATGNDKSGQFPPTTVSETVSGNFPDGFGQATLDVVQSSPSQITFSFSAEADSSGGMGTVGGQVRVGPQIMLLDGPPLTDVTIRATAEVPGGVSDNAGLDGRVQILSFPPTTVLHVFAPGSYNNSVTLKVSPGTTITMEIFFQVVARLGEAMTGSMEVTITSGPEAPPPPAEEGKPDLLIKRGDEPDTAFSDESKTQTVAPGHTAFYDVKVENDGTAFDSFVFKAVGSDEPGWTVQYFFGAADITSSAGSFVTLGPSESTLITVAMTPDGTVQPGTSKSTTIQAFVDAADTTVRDAVRATTTAATSTIVVNSTGDGADANEEDEVCDTGKKTPIGEPEWYLLNIPGQLD